MKITFLSLGCCLYAVADPGFLERGGTSLDKGGTSLDRGRGARSDGTVVYGSMHGNLKNWLSLSKMGGGGTSCTPPGSTTVYVHTKLKKSHYFMNKFLLVLC